MYPPSGVRCTLRTECDVPSERSVILPPSVGRLSLRAEGNTPSELWRTVYGFFIGLLVLVRLRVLRCKTRWFGRCFFEPFTVSSLVYRSWFAPSFAVAKLAGGVVFFCEPSMGLSSVCGFWVSFRFAGANRKDKVRLFWDETRA